ncbi:MAG: S41 family peptidase [Verrucomicrobiota bacterium]|nr:S41 family peptidase [Verrucomicrobiota bacterium]
MIRVICLASIGFLTAIAALAQSPTPSSSPATSAAAGSKSSPAAPTTEELINSLNSADLQAAIALLKSNFTDPDAINETQLNRATLEGLMVRLGPGLMLLPDKGSAPSELPSPFYGELLEGHIGYLRFGTFTTANLQAMEKKLAEFAAKKIDALIVDLRASSASDFNISAEFAKRFCPKSKMLFSLRKQGKQDRAFNSDRDPSYQGLIVVLADGDTGGGVEAFAGALRFYDKALIIGQSTAGRAVEYSDLPLPSGKILRVAVSEAVSPDGHSLYPAGVKPDLPVEMSPVDKRQIFHASAEKGMGPFIYETERPHLNEAALMAGTNPELESIEQRRGRSQANLAPRDSVLQRALDLVTSLEIYGKR